MPFADWRMKSEKNLQKVYLVFPNLGIDTSRILLEAGGKFIHHN